MSDSSQPQPESVSAPGAAGATAGSAPGSAEEGADGRPLLVVDDDRLARFILVRHLKARGFATLEAECGWRAFEILDEQPVDLVLLDLVMPEMDGHGILKLLKADPRLNHIPVIMVSGMDDLNEVVGCIASGADDYLPKPFSPVLLDARINACLERKRLRDREQAHLRELQWFNQELEQRVQAGIAEIQAKNELLEARLREVDAMVNVSTSMISVLDLGLLLEQIMELSKEVMHAEASSLLVVDKEIGKLRFAVARGSAGSALKAATVELGQGISGTVALTGEPLLIPDAYQDSRFNPEYDRKTGFHTRSILTVPVRTKEEIIGVVQVINKRDRGGVRRARPAPLPVVREPGRHRHRERSAL